MKKLLTLFVLAMFVLGGSGAVYAGSHLSQEDLETLREKAKMDEDKGRAPVGKIRSEGLDIAGGDAFSEDRKMRMKDFKERLKTDRKQFRDSIQDMKVDCDAVAADRADACRQRARDATKTFVDHELLLSDRLKDILGALYDKLPATDRMRDSLDACRVDLDKVRDTLVTVQQDLDTTDVRFDRVRNSHKDLKITYDRCKKTIRDADHDIKWGHIRRVVARGEALVHRLEALLKQQGRDLTAEQVERAERDIAALQEKLAAVKTATGQDKIAPIVTALRVLKEEIHRVVLSWDSDLGLPARDALKDVKTDRDVQRINDAAVAPVAPVGVTP